MHPNQATAPAHSLENELVAYLKQSAPGVQTARYGKADIYPHTVSYVTSRSSKGVHPSEVANNPLFVLEENKRTTQAYAYQDKAGELHVVLKDLQSPQAKIHAAKATEKFLAFENKKTCCKVRFGQSIIPVLCRYAR